MTATGGADPVVDLVAGALARELSMDSGQVRHIASVAVDAMLPDGSALIEQCGVRFAVGGDVSLIGICELAERVGQFTSDEHVHRFVLTTPWTPRRPRPSPTTRRRSENPPGRRSGPPDGP